MKYLGQLSTRDMLSRGVLLNPHFWRKEFDSHSALDNNKSDAVQWALRLQRVVLQGSFASWALLYYAKHGIN
jgi:hypothetical protein